jgi:hypothetical protein
MDDAIMYVILVLVFVFDPLAVMLVISGNFILKIHLEEKEAKRLRLIVEDREQNEYELDLELKSKVIETPPSFEEELEADPEVIEEAHQVAEPILVEEPIIEPEPEIAQIEEDKPARRRKQPIDEPKPHVKDLEELESALKIELDAPVEKPEEFVWEVDDASIKEHSSMWNQDNQIEDSNEIVLPESVMDTLHVDHAHSNVTPDANFGKPKWAGETLLNFYKQESPFNNK